MNAFLLEGLRPKAHDDTILATEAVNDEIVIREAWAAFGDIAYRYALVNGNAFAVIGADYSSFNQNGELDIYNSNTGEGQLSGDYLTDRSAYISALLGENIADATLGSGTDVRYFDALNGTMMESISPGVPSRYAAFGSDQADSNLTGTDYVDHLYGMGGNEEWLMQEAV